MVTLNFEKIPAQMVMSTQEEAASILQDIYANDDDASYEAINALCEEHGIAYDEEVNGEEIYNLIIDNEDRLLQNYYNENPSEAPVEVSDEMEEEEEEEEVSEPSGIIEPDEEIRL